MFLSVIAVSNKDRDPYFSYLNKPSFLSHATNMVTLVGLRHPVTILVTDFTSPDKLITPLPLVHWSQI